MKWFSASRLPCAASQAGIVRVPTALDKPPPRASMLAMPSVPAGTLTLTAVAARLRMLDVACHRCDRRGRLSTARLLQKHGNISVPMLLELLSADCPRRQAMEHGQLADPCGIHAPELPRLF